VTDSRRAQEVIQQVVRGEQSWSELSSLGISLQFFGDVVEISNPYRVSAVVHAPDVAAGLLRHAQNALALRQWAKVLLTGSSLVELNLGDEPDGEILLEGLWDVSFDGTLSSTVLATARQIVARG
jgi:hypothetical protein